MRYGKDMKKRIIQIFLIIFLCGVISSLCGMIIRTTYMYPYIVADDFSTVTYFDKKNIYVADIPDYIDQDTEGIVENGKFESQSLIEKTFASKTLITVFRYDTDDTVYLKVAVSPNILVTIGEPEERIYYFEQS